MRKTKSLNEVLHAWMKKSGKERLFHEIQIKDMLFELFGTSISTKIKKVNWLEQDQLLIVSVKDPLLRNELSYTSNSIKTKLNDQLKDIEIRKIIWN